MTTKRRVDPSHTIELSGAAYNAIMAELDSWRNLEIKVVNGASLGGRILRSEGRSVIVITVPQSGDGGSGLPDGVTFEEFTICDSGSPASRWLATWTSDPS